jgi:low temperature requirement protein LtrA
MVRARAPVPCLTWSLHWAWLSKGFRCPAAIVSILRGTGWLEPDRLPVQLLLVGLMFVSLLISVAIAEEFGGRAWLFVAAYLLLQVGRAVFLIVALRGRALGEHSVNVLVWELIAGGLWVAGAIAEGTARLALWGFAVVVAYGGAGILHWLPGRGQRVGLARRSRANRHRGRASLRTVPTVLPHWS